MIHYLVLLAVLILLYIIFFRGESFRAGIVKTFKVKEAKQGVAIDAKHFYAISNSHIGKYKRKTGEKVLSKSMPFKHLNGGKMIDGDLVVVNNPTGKSARSNALVWLDPTTLNVIDILQLPQIRGSLTWADWAWNKWWVCDAWYGKDAKKTTIYCFNEDWILEGYWRLPKQVIEEISPYSLSGGEWFGEWLCVSGHDKPEMYVLELPTDKIHAKLLKTVPVCFDGQGFSFDRGKKHTYVWGIRRKDSVVVRCAINLD